MRWFAGMERKRSRFGKWMDGKGISQMELSRRSGVASNTINNLATGTAGRPARRTGQKLMKAIREVDPAAKESEFWDV